MEKVKKSETENATNEYCDLETDISAENKSCCEKTAEKEDCCEKTAENKSCCNKTAEKEDCCEKTAENKSCCEKTAENKSCCEKTAENKSCCEKTAEKEDCCEKTAENKSCCEKTAENKSCCNKTAEKEDCCEKNDVEKKACICKRFCGFVKRKWKLLVGLILGFWFLIYLFILFAVPKIIISVIEKYTPQIIGCDIAIDKISISPALNGIEIDAVILGNPEGFRNKEAFKMAFFEVKIQLSSIFSDIIVIDKIIIDGVEVNSEISGLDSNFLAMKTNFEKFISENFQQETKEIKEKVEVAEETGKQQISKRFIIKKLQFTNGKMHSGFSLFGIGADLPIPLPTIDMENIGVNPEGTQQGDTIMEVVKDVAAFWTKHLFSSSETKLDDVILKAETKLKKVEDKFLKKLEDKKLALEKKNHEKEEKEKAKRKANGEETTLDRLKGLF